PTGFTINTTAHQNASPGSVCPADAGPRNPPAFPTRRSSDLGNTQGRNAGAVTLTAGGVLTTNAITAMGSAPTTASNTAGTGGAVSLTGTRIDVGGNIRSEGGRVGKGGGGRGGRRKK